MANPPVKYSGLYIRPRAPVRHPSTRRPIRYDPRGVLATPHRPFSQYRRPDPVDTFTTRHTSPPRRIIIFWRAILTSIETNPRAFGLVTGVPGERGFLVGGTVTIVAGGASVDGTCVAGTAVGTSVTGTSVVGATVFGGGVAGGSVGGTMTGATRRSDCRAHDTPSTPATSDKQLTARATRKR